MTKKDLADILSKHAKWLRDEDGGERANLQDADVQDADLQDADLRGADLQCANLRDANLRDANLQCANLQEADLQGADLQRADLQRANLRGADLRDADLQRADLRGAYLRGADLRGADLSGADLKGANLRDANLRGADLQDADLQEADLQGANLRGANNAALVWAMTIVAPQGDFIGWKKAVTPGDKECIVKLRIPSEARRSNTTGRKCRAEWAEVLEVEGAEYAYTNKHGPRVEYRPGQIVRPDSWDEDRWNECSHGIHFFITREEALAWRL